MACLYQLNDQPFFAQGGAGHWGRDTEPLKHNPSLCPCKEKQKRVKVSSLSTAVECHLWMHTGTRTYTATHPSYTRTSRLGTDRSDAHGTASARVVVSRARVLHSCSGLREFATTPCPLPAVYRSQSSWNEGRLGRGQINTREASKQACKQVLNSP